MSLVVYGCSVSAATAVAISSCLDRADWHRHALALSFWCSVGGVNIKSIDSGARGWKSCPFQQPISLTPSRFLQANAWQRPCLLSPLPAFGIVSRYFVLSTWENRWRLRDPSSFSSHVKGRMSFLLNGPEGFGPSLWAQSPNQAHLLIHNT